MEDLVRLIDRFQTQLRQTRHALLECAQQATRWPRLPLVAALLVGTMVLPSAAGPQAPAASTALHLYRQLTGDPGSLRLALTQDYEIGLDNTIYGPLTQRAVPWERVVAWAADHPAVAVLHTQSDMGWHFAVLRLQGGYAYLVYTGGGEVAKLHLAAQPEQWDG